MNCIYVCYVVIDNDLLVLCWVVCIWLNLIRFMEVICIDKVCTIREIFDFYI